MSADPESRSQQQPPAASVATAEREEQSPGVSRRGFLKAGAGAAAVLAAAGPAAALTGDQGHDHMAPEPPKSAEEQVRRAKAEAEWYERFSEPPHLSLESSSENTFNGTLSVIMTPITFSDTLGTRTENVRTYNGHVPGPTIRVRAGEALKVKVINDLPKNTDQYCADTHHHNEPHCFNTTNLHVHGLHVSPELPSDNVFLEIPPAGSYDFCFQLPAFHKPGTHWYHAHKHGSTAIQLVNGMAGALIVEDPPDQQLSPKPFADMVMIIQEIVAEAKDVYYCASLEPEDQREPRKSVFYVNGLYRSTINVIAGEWYRWRFINATATPRGFTPLQLRSGSTGLPMEMTLIAVDGIYLPNNTSKPVKDEPWLLAPGNRADFLVQFKEAGSYTVFKNKYTPGGEQALLEIQATAPATRKMVMAMAVATPSLPEYLRPFTKEEIAKARRDGKVKVVTFMLSMHDRKEGDKEACAGKFQVDGKAFDPDDDRGPIQVNLGDTELWTIYNSTNAAHPFHIHVNPFQVIDNNRTPIDESERYWQDTVTVPANGYVEIATRFLTFPGTFVLHCHILIHEDWGMMRKVQVVDRSGKGYGSCKRVP